MNAKTALRVMATLLAIVPPNPAVATDLLHSGEDVAANFVDGRLGKPLGTLLLVHARVTERQNVGQSPLPTEFELVVDDVNGEALSVPQTFPFRKDGYPYTIGRIYSSRTTPTKDLIPYPNRQSDSRLFVVHETGAYDGDVEPDGRYVPRSGSPARPFALYSSLVVHFEDPATRMRHEDEGRNRVFELTAPIPRTKSEFHRLFRDSCSFLWDTSVELTFDLDRLSSICFDRLAADSQRSQLPASELEKVLRASCGTGPLLKARPLIPIGACRVRTGGEAVWVVLAMEFSPVEPQELGFNLKLPQRCGAVTSAVYFAVRESDSRILETLRCNPSSGEPQ